MPLQLTPLDESQLSQDVIRAVGHKAPDQARMMAARGLVPLSPADLAAAVYQLTFDHDQGIVAAARAQALKLPPAILAPALAENLDAQVLDFFAQVIDEKPTLVQEILLNRNTADQTLIDLAGKIQEGEIEVLAANQARLLKCPAIIEKLYFNKRARMSTVQRLLELAARRGIELSKIPHFKATMADIFGQAVDEPLPEEPPPAPPMQPPPAAPVQPQDLTETWDPAMAEGDMLDSALGMDGDLDAGLGDLDFGADGLLDSAFNDAMVGEDWEEDAFDGLDDLDGLEDEEALNKLSTLPVNARIRLATLGSAMHRAILIKDSNRLVALAAVSSPAVSDTEACRFASNRSLSEDVIRFICAKREWHKNYQVKVSLAFNPKTPLTHSMRLLNHLRGIDLKQLSLSRNVSVALRQAAKRLVKTRSGH